VIHRAPFNVLISVLIITLMWVGTVPAQGACPCGPSTADHDENSQGSSGGFRQPHDCCSAGTLTQYDFDQDCTFEALLDVRAVAPRVEAPLLATSLALSNESSLFHCNTPCLPGRDLTHPGEALGPLDFRNLSLRC
jgi:hypothetical protein